MNHRLAAPSYDDNGNQTAAGTDTFEWDAENRMIATNIASTAGAYAYNGDGLRITRALGAGAVSYVWDLNASLPVILKDTAGNRYVYGLDLLTRINGSTEEWYLYDGLGSTTGLADATGTVTGTYTYDVFGAVRTQTGSTTEWSYTGEQNDPTGLEYLRARYYDSATGRFLAQDPLPSQNEYAYVGNNPLSYVDPDGQCRVEVGWRPANAFGGLFSKFVAHAFIVTADPLTGEKMFFEGRAEGGTPGVHLWGTLRAQAYRAQDGGASVDRYREHGGEHVYNDAGSCTPLNWQLGAVVNLINDESIHY